MEKWNKVSLIPDIKGLPPLEQMYRTLAGSKKASDSSIWGPLSRGVELRSEIHLYRDFGRLDF